MKVQDSPFHLLPPLVLCERERESVVKTQMCKISSPHKKKVLGFTCLIQPMAMGIKLMVMEKYKDKTVVNKSTH